jgi:hypothetical protein
MNNPRDRELSRAYREGAWPESRQQLDDAIVEATRRAARERRSKSLVWRFGLPFALAAVVVAASGLVLRIYEEQALTVSLPAASKRVAPRVQPAPRPAEEPKALVEAVPAPKSEPAPSPGLIQEPQAPKPAPVQSAPVGSAFAPKREPPVVRRTDAPQREFDQIPSARVVEAAPARPAPPQIGAPAAQVPDAAAASGATAVAARAPIVLERTPQAWIDDIRKLKAQARAEDAERELAAFTKRYPDYQLPEDLR